MCLLLPLRTVAQRFPMSSSQCSRPSLAVRQQRSRKLQLPLCWSHSGLAEALHIGPNGEPSEVPWRHSSNSSVFAVGCGSPGGPAPACSRSGGDNRVGYIYINISNQYGLVGLDHGEGARYHMCAFSASPVPKDCQSVDAVALLPGSFPLELHSLGRGMVYCDRGGNRCPAHRAISSFRRHSGRCVCVCRISSSLSRDTVAARLTLSVSRAPHLHPVTWQRC